MRKGVVNNKKQKKMKKHNINFCRIICILCFVYFAFCFVKQQFVINSYNIQISHIESQIQESINETQYLTKSENNINNAEYIEGIAREELGLVKPYEKIFIDVNK